MTHGCKIDKQDGAYIMTFTVVDWLDIFSDDKYKFLLSDLLNYAVDKKGLEIFAYVIMSTHMHLLGRAINNNLSDVIRDFKKFSAIKILSLLQKTKSEFSCLALEKFSNAAKNHSRNEKYQFWKYGNYPEEVYSPKFTLQKIRYIHNNPVDAGIVSRPEDYYFSSAVDYAGRKGPVTVSLLNLHNLYYL
jgi:REP element-mobilizing transposase RayT